MPIRFEHLCLVYKICTSVLCPKIARGRVKREGKEKSQNLPRRQGRVSASIMISENLLRRTGLAANAGPDKGFEWRGIWSSIAISENLPRLSGLAANARPKGFE